MSTTAPHAGNILDAFRNPGDPIPRVQRLPHHGETVDCSQHRDLTLMLISAHEIVTGAHREQQRLRALAKSGATTAPKILLLLNRLERLAIRGAQINLQLQWLDEDLKHHGLHPLSATVYKGRPASCLPSLQSLS